MSVNKENMRAWVAALRSGEFVQGEERLAILLPDRVTFAFCCLGVACELAARTNDKIVVGAMKDTLGRSLRGYDENASVLPESVQEWLGVHEAAPSVLFGERYVELTHLNDNMHLPFSEIADLIEVQFNLLGKEETLENAAE